MKIEQFRGILEAKQQLILWLLPLLALAGWLLFYRLGTLVPGLSHTELQTFQAKLGWHDIYQQPLELPLKLVRAAVFSTFPDHGQFLTRAPNALFGALSILAFAGVARLWHGTRTAVLSTLLFACSAWTLHASRVASFDVLYIWAMTTLMLSHTLLHKYARRPAVWYGSLLVWGLLLYVPGMIWLLIAGAWLQRRALIQGWRHFGSLWQRLLSLSVIFMWLPLLIIDLFRPGQLIQWLGFPEHLTAGSALLKQFVAVPVHLFMRGPQYPDLWLDRTPLLDIFTLVVCLLGIYFYILHWQASRSHLLGGLFILSSLLTGLGSTASFSLLIPLLYLAVATGLAFLTHEWLRVFPRNPLARSLGIGLIFIVVALSCLYNVRSYFVAWPHTAVTRSTFHYRP